MAPTGDSPLEWIIGLLATITTAWVGKLHVDISKVRSELADHKQTSISRSEMKEEFREQFALFSREMAQNQATVTAQLVALNRTIDRLEARLDNERSR